MRAVCVNATPNYSQKAEPELEMNTYAQEESLCSEHYFTVQRMGLDRETNPKTCGIEAMLKYVEKVSNLFII